METDPIPHGRRFEFSGGALCLDFVNTLGDRPRCANERLRSYADLLSWSEEAGIIDVTERTKLERCASRPPSRATEVLGRSIEFREALFRLFATKAAGGEAADPDLAALNEILAPGLVHLRLDRTSEGIHWSWIEWSDHPESPLWPVARSAADLLTSEDLPRVRQCASETCSWMFLDHSRSRCRRWCDMKTCGNRAKARRHYRRRKAAAS